MDVNEKDRIDILTRCGHRIPGGCLEDLEEVWKMNHDADELHEFWKKRFLRNLDI